MCANVTPITFIAMLVSKYFYIEIINNFCIFHNLKDVGTHTKKFQGHKWIYIYIYILIQDRNFAQA